MDIAEFALARLGEDENYARSALTEASDGAAIRVVDGELAIRPSAASAMLTVHIIRNAPARAIRKAEGMRAIVRRYQAQAGRAHLNAMEEDRAWVLWLPVAYLAATWNDHPDYDQEWDPLAGAPVTE